MDAEEIILRAPQVRRMLWWSWPLSAGLCVLSWWTFIVVGVYEIEGLLQLAPTVRIGPAALLGPFGAGICAVSLVLGPLRAIPYTGVWSGRLEWLMTSIIAACVPVLLLIVFGSTLIQNHYMPKLGYSKCTLLQGNPTLWFTDWVKNPEWCVKGKSREWVHEQAGAPPPKD